MPAPFYGCILRLTKKQQTGLSVLAVVLALDVGDSIGAATPCGG